MIETSEPITAALCAAWFEQAKQLLAAGHGAEAAALAAQLAKAAPRSFRIWILLADCQAALGDSAAEIAALEGALDLQPLRGSARDRLAKLLLSKGELAAAAAHYQWLSDAEEPVQPKRLLQLTALYHKLGCPELEAAAWTRLVAIKPDRARGHGRLAELHLMAGRSREAVPHVRRALQARPQKVKLWILLAEVCEDIGELDEAEAAWIKVAELDPRSLSAEQRLADVRMLKGAASAAVRSGSAAAARLSVLGNCQAHVLAQCLRRLNPDLDVISVNWFELASDQRLERVGDSLGQADAVIVQPNAIPRFASLSAKALAERGLRTVGYPRVVFTGFHPDALHVSPGARLRSLIGDWHSTLMLAGYRLGLPAHRTAGLFNAYIYGVLGYFEEYANAERYLRSEGRRVGWELSAEFDEWRGQGCFVHTPNHPRIGVMMSLARGVCRSLGLEFDAAATAPPDPFDLAWPVYPEIGKRLGVEGALTFTTSLDGGQRLGLDGAIDWFYEIYARAPAESLQLTRVEEVISILRAEGI